MDARRDSNTSTKLGTIEVTAQVRKPENTIDGLGDVADKYDHLSREQKEHLYAVFLTSANEEIGDKLIGLGGNGSAPFDVQDVVRTPALVNAAAVILVHNHPSGNTQPTWEDSTPPGTLTRSSTFSGSNSWITSSSPGEAAIACGRTGTVPSNGISLPRIAGPGKRVGPINLRTPTATRNR